MKPLTQFKNAHPEYSKYPDAKILQAIRTKYPSYAQYDDEQLSEALETRFSPQARPEGGPLNMMARKMGRGIADVAKTVGEAGTSLGRGAGRMFASLPSVAGGILQEMGERAELDPDTAVPSAVSKVVPFIGESYVLARKGIASLAKRSSLDESMVQMGTQVAQKNLEKVSSMFPRGDRRYQRFFEDIGSGGASLAMAVGISAATKSPMAAAALFGVMQKSRMYQEARATGMDPEKAGDISSGSGFAEGALEKVGLDIFLKSYGSVLRSTLIKTAEEAIQEMLQSAADSGIANFAGIRSESAWEIIKNVLYEGLIGAIVGGGTSVAIDKGVSDLRQHGVPEEITRQILENSQKKINADIQDVLGDAYQREEWEEIEPSEEDWDTLRDVLYEMSPAERQEYVDWWEEAMTIQEQNPINELQQLHNRWRGDPKAKDRLYSILADLEKKGTREQRKINEMIPSARQQMYRHHRNVGRGEFFKGAEALGEILYGEQEYTSVMQRLAGAFQQTGQKKEETAMQDWLSSLSEAKQHAQETEKQKQRPEQPKQEESPQIPEVKAEAPVETNYKHRFTFDPQALPQTPYAWLDDFDPKIVDNAVYISKFNAGTKDQVVKVIHQEGDKETVVGEAKTSNEAMKLAVEYWDNIDWGSQGKINNIVKNVEKGESQEPEEGFKPSDLTKDRGSVIPKKGEGEALIDKYNNPQGILADEVYKLMKAGGVIKDNPALNRMAERAFGGKRADGIFQSQDMYNALEEGVNKYVRELITEHEPSVEEVDNTFYRIRKKISPEKRKELLDKLIDLQKRIPTQTHRTAEKDDFQQFSTPPAMAYAAGLMLDVQKDDIILEPSAGTGNLAVTVQPFADVITNEIDESRTAVLDRLNLKPLYQKNAGFDAEILDDVLPDDVRPTAIIMNPPFSSTGGRLSKSKNSAKYGFRHIDQALRRLAPGGRLVAILGESAWPDRQIAQDWYNNLGKEYTVQAMIKNPKEAYRKYGTNFGTIYLVIDKVQRSRFSEAISDETYVAEHQSLEEVLESIENIPTRAAISAAAQPATAATEESDTDKAGTEPVASPKERVSGGRGGGSGTAGSGGGGTSTTSPGRGGQVDREPGERSVPEAPSPAVGTERGSESAERSESVEEPEAEPAAPGPEPTGSPGGPGVNVQFETDYERRQKRQEESAGKFVDYVPSKLKGGKAHPGKIVESSSMAAIETPDIKYKPDLKGMKNPIISALQLEAVSLAGQCHDIMLPSGHRMGFSLGDGTGVGKGIQIAATILDNWNHGRRRAVWLSYSKDLADDAARDFGEKEGLGIDHIIPLGVLNDKKVAPSKGPVQMGDGCIFCTYATLIKKNRLDQLVEWLGPDGVIVFDEGHKAKNAFTGKGLKKPTQTGLTVVDLQENLLPKARVLYASATGATELANMGYMVRLGLWGEGTQFDSFEDFISEVNTGGMGAMEMVARDLKAQGKYLARSLSYEGVKYTEVKGKMTPKQREVWNSSAEIWRTIVNNIGAAIEATNAGKKQRSLAIRMLWGNHQRFARQMIMAFKVPTIIKQTEAQLKKENSVIIGLFGTGEAALKRAVQERLEQGEDLEALDLTPRQMIGNYLENCFPVNLFQEEQDSNGNVVHKPVIGPDGKPVQSKLALQLRQRLMDSLSDLNLPDNPMDQIIKYFDDKADKTGDETWRVAELTGRKKVLRVNKNTGKKEWVRRGPAGSQSASKWEEENFQSGKKRIAIVSAAASQGISLHASRRAKNQQKRVFITMELSWSADQQMQQFGRGHRSNQAQPPEYIILTMDLGGESRFSSTIAKRLGSLGALTRGQRGSAGSGDVLDKYDYSSDYGSLAVAALYTSLLNGQEVPGIDNPIQTLLNMNVVYMDEYGSYKINEGDKTNINKFLNRILVLDADEQNALHEHYHEIFSALVEDAKEKGVFDDGVEDLVSKQIRLINRTEIRKDKAVGATTEHIEMERDVQTTPLKWEDAEKMLQAGFDVHKNTHSGHYVITKEAATKTDPETGRIQRRFYEYRYTGAREITSHADLQAKFKPVKKENKDFKAWWEKHVKEYPAIRTEEVHLIAGMILPLWNRMKSNVHGAPLKIVRATTVDGQRFVGVRIPNKAVDAVLSAIGVNRKLETPEQVYNAVMNSRKPVELENGIQLMRRYWQGGDIIELIGTKTPMRDTLRKLGILYERVQFKDMFYIPGVEEKALDIIKKLTDRWAVANQSSPSFGSTSMLRIPASDLGQGQPRPKGASDLRHSDMETKKPRQDMYRSSELIDYHQDRTGAKGMSSNDLAGGFRALFPEITFRAKMQDRWRRDKMGEINSDRNMIKGRNFASPVADFHETAHWFQNQIFGDYRDNELRWLEKGATPDMMNELRDLDYDQNKRRTGEGFAEFVRLWISDSGAEAFAPMFTRYFETSVLPEYDKSGRFWKAKQMVGSFVAQDAVEFTKSQLGFHRPRTNAARTKEKVRQFKQAPSEVRKKKVGSAWSKFKSKFSDSAAEIQYLLKSTLGDRYHSLPARLNPITVFRAYNMKAGAMAEQMLNHGVYDIRTGMGMDLSKGAVQTLRECDQEGYQIQDLITYLYARHAIDWIHHPELDENVDIVNGDTDLGFLDEQERIKIFKEARRKVQMLKPKNPGISLAQAKAVVERLGNSHFERWGDEINNYFDQLMQLVYHEGGVSNATLKYFRWRHPHYVPFLREIAHDVVWESRHGKKGMANQNKPYMRAKGSDYPWQYYMDAWIKHTERVVLWATKARVMNAFASFAHLQGMAPLIRETDPPPEVTKHSVKEIVGLLTKMGADISNKNQMLEIEGDTLVEFWHNGVHVKKGRPIVSVWRNGKRAFYELHPDLFNFIQSIEAAPLVGIAKVMAPFCRGIRLGATGLNPNFILLRNVIRDAIEATVMSESGKAHPFRSIQGLLAEIYKDKDILPVALKKLGVDPEYADLYMKAGGVVSTMAGFDRTKLEKMARLAESNIKGKTIQFGLQHPIEGLRLLFSAFENTNRIPEFKAVYEKVMNQTGDPEEAFIRAARASQDITTDFARAGYWGRQLNQIIPFYNANVQGFSKFIRGFFGKEITGYHGKYQAESSRKNAGKRMAKALGWITGLSLLSYFLRDDEEWEKLNDWERANYFHFWVNGDHLKVVTPFLLGAVFHGGLHAALLEGIGDRQADEEYLRFLWDQHFSELLPLPTSWPFVSTIMEIKANRSWSGRPIEPKYARQTQEAWTIANEWTTELSKSIMAFKPLRSTGISPAQFEYFVNQTTGGFYRRTIGAADRLIIKNLMGKNVKDRPAGLWDIPIIGDLFARPSTMNNRLTARFFSAYSDAMKRQHSENRHPYHNLLENTYKKIVAVRRRSNYPDERKDKKVMELIEKAVDHMESKKPDVPARRSSTEKRRESYVF